MTTAEILSYCDFSKVKHPLNTAVLKKYLPGQRNNCEAKILGVRQAKFSKFQRGECWLSYAKMLRSNRNMSHNFGSTWYRGVRIQGQGQGDQGQGQCMQGMQMGKKGKSISNKCDRNSNDLLVGINEHAITLRELHHAARGGALQYQMEEILTFGYRSNV